MRTFIQIALTTVAAIVIIVILGVTKYFQITAAIAQGAKMAPGPAAVTTAIATKETWPRMLTAVGSLRAVQGVTLSSEEAGRVDKILFESGSKVDAGQILVELDSSVLEANLKGALARLDKARKALARSVALRQRAAISEESLDAAEAEQRQADAEVQSLKAQISHMRILAPFAGRTGIRLGNIGQYVAQGTPLVPLYSLDPMYANFTLPQQSIRDVELGQRIGVVVDAYPDKVFEGKITAINPQVDLTTRNIDIQGTIVNHTEQLLPGMFARVEIHLADSDEVIRLPATSISFAPYGDSVFVVEHGKAPDGSEQTIVRQQFVKIGARRGEQVAVTQGLSGGEEVVSSGVFKLRPGAPILVNNVVSPGNNAVSNPPDA